jgi:hypothetical protein
MHRTALPRLAARSASALLVALAAALPAAAQEEPTRFLVERIVVVGLERETARQIVLTESLLQPGRSYTEQELREAVFRVKRLPFIVDATLTLGKGSERGAYELRIEIEAAKPVAYALEAAGVGSTPRFPGDDRFDGGATGTVGVRRFVGARGLLFASAQGFDSSALGSHLQVGYTRYGLFGRAGGFGTVALASTVGGELDADDLESSVQVGIPLAGNHALRGGVVWTHFEASFPGFVEGIVEQRRDTLSGNLAWLYDRTDHPLVPTEGLRFSLTGAYSESRHRLREVPAESLIELLEESSDVATVLAEARNYWRLTPRQAVALGGFASYREVSVDPDFENTERLAGLEAVHASDLWGHPTARHRGDLRLETLVAVSRLSSSSGGFFGTVEETWLEARTSLLFRHAWGLVRLSLVWVEPLEESG